MEYRSELICEALVTWFTLGPSTSEIRDGYAAYINQMEAGGKVDYIRARHAIIFCTCSLSSDDVEQGGNIRDDVILAREKV